MLEPTKDDDTRALLRDILDELRAANSSSRLWSSADVARYFGVSAQSARNRILCKPEFPRPVQVPGVGRRWKPSEVRAYAERR